MNSWTQTDSDRQEQVAGQTGGKDVGLFFLTYNFSPLRHKVGSAEGLSRLCHSHRNNLGHTLHSTPLLSLWTQSSSAPLWVSDRFHGTE